MSEEKVSKRKRERAKGKEGVVNRTSNLISPKYFPLIDEYATILIIVKPLNISLQVSQTFVRLPKR
jgi:hypothetical protein